ncbi:MAG: Zn-ribbon domain-containing OB-fold protein [Polymorphobacter sp.]|jgi:uncharacterized OB-fold protein
MIEGSPVPARTGPFEADFWAILDEGRLAHQHCYNCGAWHFPARWRCACGGALVYVPVSGKARLWSWTEVHAPVLPAFTAFTPYVVGIVELAEAAGLRMIGPLLNAPKDPINAVRKQDLQIGMPLQAVVCPLSTTVAWPSWLLA